MKKLFSKLGSAMRIEEVKGSVPLVIHTRIPGLPRDATMDAERQIAAFPGLQLLSGGRPRLQVSATSQIGAGCAKSSKVRKTEQSPCLCSSGNYSIWQLIHI